MRHLTPANLLNECQFRYAQTEDVDALVALIERFFEEAVYKDFITLDPVRARKTTAFGIENSTRPHLVAVIDGEIVGFISWELDWSFSVRPVSVLFEVYVIPERRRSAIGRYLIGLWIWASKDSGACALHAPVASGLKETASMKNLFGKLGFTELGFIMRLGGF